MALLPKDKGNRPDRKDSTGIDATVLRAKLAEIGIKEYELAGVTRIPPAKLSALVNCRLDGKEADKLRCRIESVLALEPGALLPRPEKMETAGKAEKILADAASDLRALAQSCRSESSRNDPSYCEVFEQVAFDVASSRAEAFPSAEATAEAEEIASEAGFELVDEDDDAANDDDEEVDHDEAEEGATLAATERPSPKRSKAAKKADGMADIKPMTIADSRTLSLPSLADQVRAFADIGRAFRPADERKPTSRKPRR